MPEAGQTHSNSHRYPLLRPLLLLAVAILTLAGLVIRPAARARMQGSEPELTLVSPPATFTPSPSSTAAINHLPSPTPQPSQTQDTHLNSPLTPPDRELVILAIGEGVHTHLFAYRPQSLPFTRLTSGAWDDITPAISPDGTRLAFASDRDGPWDLYQMDLSSGEIVRLTDTPGYEASPSWSPDGRWLAYEAYPVEEGAGSSSGGLDIFIRSIDGDQPPIRLTDDPGADFAPSWSPQGRQIAFVSTRSGESEIWIGDLDRIDDRFQDISQKTDAVETRPAWSSDGDRLAWVSTGRDGVQGLYVWDRSAPSDQAGAALHFVGGGAWPAWSPDGKALLTSLVTPNKEYLTGYDLQNEGMTLPPLPLSGQLEGLAWGRAGLPASLQPVAQLTPTALSIPQLTPESEVPGGRQRVVPLSGVDAPAPLLQDLVDESFQALRREVASQAGWDFLSMLENAYVPLTSPLSPGMVDDWLYTGRAFAFNSLPMNAGWLALIRQDFGSQTYWRVYLRARFQDGSQGAPLHELPWNIGARFSGDPRAYEQGGSLAREIPTGYWIDLTRLAAAYGWERLPALVTWRSAYTTARFNEFALTDGQDWRSAMLEIYPPEVLVTPTAIIPTPQPPGPTVKPTRTPVPTRTPWPTRTPTATRTSSPYTPTQAP